MAFESYGPDNYKYDGKTEYREHLPPVMLGWPGYYRDITVEAWRYRGMTLDAAEDCRAALYDPDNGVQASLEAENDAGWYQVIVSAVTEGDWTAE